MSFIASLGTFAAGLVGVTGLSAGTASLIGAGTLAAGGAGLGAGISAATGGDPGEGALMGGIAGLGAGAAGAGLGAAGAGAAGAGAGAGTGLMTTPLVGGGGAVVPAAAELTGGTAAGIGDAVVAGVAPTTSAAAGSTVAAAAPAAAPGFLGSIGEFAAAHPIMTSAGVGALGGAVTNPNDPLGGAIKGGAAGAIGGWGASELGGMAGAGGTLGKIGSFAAEHPGITSAGIGMLANPIIGSITPSFSSNKDADLSQMNEIDRQNFLRYMRNYTPSLAPGYAAGGITDLDGYMSNAQNIPNPQEVADPEGYGSNSMRLMAGGGIADLGGYAAGGRPNLLHGPGDGVSDDIPASIGGKQPARLASGEYVVSSRIVSELGNGSTDAGAARLDEMVKRIQEGRKKTIGKGKEYAKDTKPYKYLPA